MEGSINPSEAIEVILRKVELNCANYRSLQKIALTVVGLDGKQSSFSQVVRYKIVSFRDQPVKIPNCNSFSIRLGRFSGASSQEIPLGTYEVDVKTLRTSNKLQQKMEWQLPEPNCVVHFEVDILTSQPFQEQHISEQVLPAQDTSKTLETQDGSENPCVSEKFSPNLKSALQSFTSTIPDASFGKNSEIVNMVEEIRFEKNKGEGKSHGSGTITEKYDDELEQEVKELRPIAPKNHVEGNIRFSALQRSNSVNVQVRKAFEDKDTPVEKETVVKIRYPIGRKLRPFLELEDQIETILHLKYLSANSKQLQERLSSKSLMLGQQVTNLKKERDEKLEAKLQQEKKPSFLRNKLTMAAALLSGLVFSIVF